ncbi:hypothetical protein D3C75_1135130 [compost metagenome]
MPALIRLIQTVHCLEETIPGLRNRKPLLPQQITSVPQYIEEERTGNLIQLAVRGQSPVEGNELVRDLLTFRPLRIIVVQWQKNTLLSKSGQPLRVH